MENIEHMLEAEKAPQGIQPEIAEFENVEKAGQENQESAELFDAEAADSAKAAEAADSAADEQRDSPLDVAMQENQESAEHAHSSCETEASEASEASETAKPAEAVETENAKAADSAKAADEQRDTPVDVAMHDAADPREGEHTQHAPGPRDAGEIASAQPQPEQLRVAVLEEQNAALQNAARVHAAHAAAQEAKIAELMQQARDAAHLRAPRPKRPKLSVVRASGSSEVETPKTKKRSFHSGSVTGNTLTGTHGKRYKEPPMGGVPLAARVQAQTFVTTYIGRRKGKGPLIPIKTSRIGKNAFSDIVSFLDDRDDGETQKNKLPRFLVFRDAYSDWKRDHATKQMIEVPCFRPEFNVTAKALFDFSVSGSNGGVHQARMLAIQNAGTTIGPLGDAALTAYLPSEDEISRTAQWRNAPPPKRIKTTA
jgi:chemotaxis protein histidine kinase CheA